MIWNRLWYEGHPLALALTPLALLYCAAVWLRRQVYRLGLRRVHRMGVPVIVVGNITAGGTGKTPLIAWLAARLREQGYRPGIIARGYGGRARHWPQQVRPDSDPRTVGDEPVLLARRTGCPMAVGPDRVAAARALLQHSDCDILISDDGLQHYALARDIEIAVVDGDRRYGNGLCLPAGPLREPRSRLQEVDLIVCHGTPGRGEFGMHYVAGQLINVHDHEQRLDPDQLRGRQVDAVAGIGHPERFYRLLERQGLNCRKQRSFRDHHAYSETDFDFADAHTPVVMTEKDAVKCERLARDNLWYLPIQAELDPRMESRLQRLLPQSRHPREGGDPVTTAVSGSRPTPG
ncbi:tetraacyldisaccharide 4'-kinase [Thiohalobacter thiocyanaticus]|uniref:Tetraacyldisaccharide 4'-kinase n=1 Tax=Thiohalobacter thiocyanaticus TaxID=585455 RepID=A0A1Z4VRE5_9GAMM|nr:tetraacyldisaccharide 4'-kinase [Thiohalobacter thiocyanaticus]BAZ94197.1 tetraacyldisaccharide 4'-kinase [Thiohalobacter thiocyanaticus]